jgi:hypothetical protein
VSDLGLTCHVTFISDQNDLCVVPRICLDLCAPEIEMEKAFKAEKLNESVFKT